MIDRLIAELEKAGHQERFDRFGVRAGEKWRGEIVTAIHSSEVFLLILSPKKNWTWQRRGKKGYCRWRSGQSQSGRLWNTDRIGTGVVLSASAIRF
jgi:hypothetical protein